MALVIRTVTGPVTMSVIFTSPIVCLIDRSPNGFAEYFVKCEVVPAVQLQLESRHDRNTHAGPRSCITAGFRQNALVIGKWTAA